MHAVAAKSTCSSAGIVPGRDDAENYDERLREWKENCALLARGAAGDDNEPARVPDTGDMQPEDDDAGPSAPHHMDAAYVPFTQAEQSQLDGTHRRPMYIEGPRLQPEAAEQLRLGHAGLPANPSEPQVAEPDAAEAEAEPARRSARLASASQNRAEPEQTDQPSRNRASGGFISNMFNSALNTLTGGQWGSTPPPPGPQQSEGAAAAAAEPGSETEGTVTNAYLMGSPTRRQPPRAAKAKTAEQTAAVPVDHRGDAGVQAQPSARPKQVATASSSRAGSVRSRGLMPRAATRTKPQAAEGESRALAPRAAWVARPDVADGESSDEGAHQVPCR